MSELQAAHQLYLKSGRTIRGPLTLQRLQQLRDASRLSKLDQISSDRINWVVAGLVPELFEPEIVQIQSTAWFYKKDSEQVGPFCLEELRELAATSMFQPTDRVWCEGMKSWKPAHSVRELCSCFAPAVLSASISQPRFTNGIAVLAVATCAMIGVIAVIWHSIGTEAASPIVESGGAKIGDGPHVLNDLPCPVCHGQPVFADCLECGGDGYRECNNSYTVTGFFGDSKYECHAGDIYSVYSASREKTGHKCDHCNGRGEVRCDECKSRGKVEETCTKCGGSGTVRN